MRRRPSQWGAGRRTRLLGAALALLIAAPLCGVLLLNRRAPRPRTGFNVLVVTFDALRPDHMSHNGYQRKTSPALDRFASQAVRFTRASSQGTWTMPALASLFTGTYPQTHGANDFVAKKVITLPTDLAAALNKEGYLTGFFTGHPTLQELQGGLKFSATESGPLDARQLTSKAIAWLRGARQRKYFLHLHYFEPHPGAKIPRAHERAFAGDGLNPIKGTISGKHPGLAMVKRHVRPDGKLDVGALIQRYDSSIRFADQQFGLLMASLKRLGLLRRTIVVVSSDHGEYLGEQDAYSNHRRYFNHGGPPSELLTRVPLLLRVPGMAPASLDQPVQHVDLMPTLLDELGLPIPHTVEGRSLYDMLRGEKSPHEFTYSMDAESLSITVIQGQWKLLFMGGEEFRGPHTSFQLFDLGQRPWEQVNQVQQHPKKARQLKQGLRRLVRSGDRDSPLLRVLSERLR